MEVGLQYLDLYDTTWALHQPSQGHELTMAYMTLGAIEAGNEEQVIAVSTVIQGLKRLGAQVIACASWREPTSLSTPIPVIAAIDKSGYAELDYVAARFADGRDTYVRNYFVPISDSPVASTTGAHNTTCLERFGAGYARMRPQRCDIKRHMLCAKIVHPGAGLEEDITNAVDLMPKRAQEFQPSSSDAASFPAVVVGETGGTRHRRPVIGWLGGRATARVGRELPTPESSELAEYLAAHHYETANKGDLPIRVEQGHSAPGLWGVNVALTDFAVHDVSSRYNHLFPVAPVMATVHFG